MKPPAPSPVSSGSATNDVSIAASAASTALPPARRISAPADAVSGWPAATTPLATLNLQKRGMYSGTSRSRTTACSRVRRTRGSPIGSRNGVRSARGARFSP